MQIVEERTATGKDRVAGKDGQRRKRAREGQTVTSRVFTQSCAQTRKALSRCSCPSDLIPLEKSKGTKISIVSFSAECFTDKPVDAPIEVAPFVGKCSTVWIDVEGMHDRKKIQDLLEVLSIDDHMEKTIFHDHQKSCSQVIKDAFVLVVPIVTMNDGIELEHLITLQKGNTVVTFHDKELPNIETIKADVRHQHSLLNTQGRLYLMQRFVESAVDSLEPILEDYSVELEAMEDEILANTQWETMSEVHRVRKELLVIKRIMLPLHHTLRNVARDSEYYASEEEKRVARDILQHGTHMLDMVEYFISVTSDMMNLHMSSVSNRMNQVATVLAIVASIFLPPTLVAGIYSMNWQMGYPAAFILMPAMSLLFTAYFWKNGWLKVFTVPHRHSR